MNNRMKNAAAGILLLATASFAQDTAPAHPRGACGSPNVQFEVKNEKADKKNSPAQPSDKALVYVIENQRAGCFMCDTTTRFGMDGNWLGATKGNSYFSFSADPGDHHLCADLQAVTPGSETVSLTSFNAEAGKTYYFRARLTDQNNSGRGGVDWALDLEAINGDEGQFLVSSYELSSHKQKK